MYSSLSAWEAMNVNPYQAPTVVEAARLPEAPHSSRVPRSAVVAGAVVYHLFAWILLRSTPVDQQAGRLLLLNTPLFVAWAIVAWRHPRLAAAVGLMVCAMQCLIVAVMLVMDIGDWQATVIINGIILTALLAMVAVCWKQRIAAAREGE